jgi:hypothetical protein
MTDAERDARLAAILAGPWANSPEAKRSVKHLRPPVALDLAAATLDLTEVKAKKKREKTLQTLLAPHWVRPIRPYEIWLRVGLDEALTGPMLLELAIECGYVNENDARTPARALLAPLLWSEAVQTYIVDYEYLTVMLLAARVGIKTDRTEKLHPPEPDSTGAAAFSTFLAYYRVFFGDPEINIFLDSLDDYSDDDSDEAIDKETLWEVLRRKAKISEAAINASEGAIRFLEHLAAVERLALGPMRIPFAMFYAYWLAKFFGYELADEGYEKATHLYDWSKQSMAFARIAQTKLDSAGMQSILASARRLWTVAREASSEYAEALTW